MFVPKADYSLLFCAGIKGVAVVSVIGYRPILSYESFYSENGLV